MAKRKVSLLEPLLIAGYSYIKQEPLALPIADWREIQDKCLCAGGSRRAMWGETFLRNKQGLLDYECYAIIPKSRGVADVP